MTEFNIAYEDVNAAERYAEIILTKSLETLPETSGIKANFQTLCIQAFLFQCMLPFLRPENPATDIDSEKMLDIEDKWLSQVNEILSWIEGLQRKDCYSLDELISFAKHVNPLNADPETIRKRIQEVKDFEQELLKKSNKKRSKNTKDEE